MILTVTAVLKLQRVNVQQLEVLKSMVTIPDGDFALRLVIDYKRLLSPSWKESCVNTARHPTKRINSVLTYRCDDGDYHPYNIQRLALQETTNLENLLGLLQNTTSTAHAI